MSTATSKFKVNYCFCPTLKFKNDDTDGDDADDGGGNDVRVEGAHACGVLPDY